MNKIQVPEPVRNNLIMLKAERNKIDETIKMIISTVLAMSNVDNNQVYGLSEDCTELVAVET